MEPLVVYGSSDDDDDDDDEEGEEAEVEAAAQDATNNQIEGLEELRPWPDEPQLGREPRLDFEATTKALVTNRPTAAEQSASRVQVGTRFLSSSVVMGPRLPSADDQDGYVDDLDQDEEDGQADSQAHNQAQPPASPYTVNRAFLHNLTLPTVANMDIPPSPPPGSPGDDAKRAELSAKLDSFLELKRNKGVHFNTKIAASHSFKNPAQTDKLLNFVGIDVDFDANGGDGGTGQYATTLPAELWNPGGFPSWSYRKQLRQTQERVQKERSRAQGEAVQFVSAANP